MKKDKTKKDKLRKDKIKVLLKDFVKSSYYVRGVLLFIIMSIFIVILYPNLVVTQHSYKLGDVAERDIKAPKDFFIEDKEETETKRREAVDQVLTVYDYDPALSQRLMKTISQAFEELRTVFETEKEILEEPPPDENTTSVTTSEKKSPHDIVWQLKEQFEQRLGITVNKGAFKILEKEEFSKEIQDYIIQILTEILENGVVANKELLLREQDKGIALRVIGTKSETVIYNLKRYYGLDQAKSMVRIIGQPLLKHLNYTLINLIVDFCQRLIQPNITLNRNETEERKKNAAAQVKPVLHKIKSGEMLLREGERATQSQLRKLKFLEMQRSQEKLFEKSLGAVLLILCLIVIKYFVHKEHIQKTGRNFNKDLLFITCILITFFFIPKISSILFESLSHNSPFGISADSMIYGIPLASSTMLVCLIMGLDVAIPFAMIMALSTALIFQNKFEIFIYFLLNSTMAAYWMQNCRERKVFVKAGIKLGFINMVLAISIYVYRADSALVNLLWDITFAFMGGVLAGTLTAGFIPLIEMGFDYTTDITLLELANLEKPILNRLMLEAPGTYHHSVIVGSMVEAAASEIGANPLLAKVCAYYHDIGKINKPLYFIENQMDGKNRHDKLAPSMSALILISHVKDGVELARKNKLGTVIKDTIRQHHGTSLIKYFYEKAKQLKGEDAVKIEDYRYPGPKPQTREAGLVMLADVVEASSRTLENPTPSRIQGHVQKIINSVFSDGQLDECELTLKDLHSIAKSFNKILNGIHHHRIEYTEKSASGNGKDKKESNVSADQQQSKQGKDTSGKSSENGSGHLKRLGVS